MADVAASGVAASGVEAQLLVSFELGLEEWKLGFAKDLRSPKRVRAVAARDRDAVQREIARAKAALGLPPQGPVVSCYEAGRDGFWAAPVAHE